MHICLLVVTWQSKLLRSTPQSIVIMREVHILYVPPTLAIS